MENKYQGLTAIVVVFATLLMVSVAQVPGATAQSWHTFTHNVEAERSWSGKLIRSIGTIQYWELHSGIMMTPAGIQTESMMEASVILRLRWNTATQQGFIYQVIHEGEWLTFRGWKGTVELREYEGLDSYGPYFYFHLGGFGVGSDGPDSRFGTAFIRGSWEMQWFSHLVDGANLEEAGEEQNTRLTFELGWTLETIKSTVRFYGTAQKPSMDV